MSKIVELLFNLIILFTLPIALFLLFWWSSLLFTTDNKKIAIAALTGLIAGFLLDYLIQKVRKYQIYLLPKWVLITIYSLYSIYTFGFFMGVPIFNLIPGILAGYYWRQRILLQRTSPYIYKKSIKEVAIFTTAWMSVISVIAIYLGLTDEYTISNLKGMLNISLSKLQLTIFAVIGGIFLTLFQYWITQKVITIRLHKQH